MFMFVALKKFPNKTEYHELNICAPNINHLHFVFVRAIPRDCPKPLNHLGCKLILENSKAVKLRGYTNLGNHRGLPVQKQKVIDQNQIISLQKLKEK